MMHRKMDRKTPLTKTIFPASCTKIMQKQGSAILLTQTMGIGYIHRMGSRFTRSICWAGTASGQVFETVINDDGRKSRSSKTPKRSLRTVSGLGLSLYIEKIAPTMSRLI